MLKQIIMILLILLFFILPVNARANPPDINSYDYFSQQSWERIFAEDDIVDYPIIFIHGLGRRTDVWENVIETIIGDEYYEMKYMESEQIFHNYHGHKKNNTLWNVSYYTDDFVEEIFSGDLSLYADRLNEMITIIKRMTGHDQVVIVGHSMGGLVARKYMTQNQENWDSVYKLLTIGTPNLGVDTSVGIVSQLEDLKEGSDFLTELNQTWDEMRNNSDNRWGVIGGVDTKMFFNQLDNPDATDSAGPGFVKINSAIPYEEWQEATENYFEQAAYNTENFGFRLAIDSNHIGLLEAEGTFKGIHWSIRK